MILKSDLAGERLDAAVARLSGTVSRSAAQRLAEEGAVLVDGFASPEWEPCPGAWKTGDAGEPNFLMARGSVLTTRRVCLASGRCDGHRALRSPRRLLGAGSPRAGSPTHRYMPAH